VRKEAECENLGEKEMESLNIGINVSVLKS
jgi:hypothetical protein